MTTGGWISLLLSVGFVTGLFVWCIWKVLTSKKPDQELGHVEPVHEDQVDER
jgi:hypothetical protein